MKKWIFIDLAIFLLCGIVALAFAPDVFSLVIIVVMLGFIGITFSKGMWTVLNYAEGFRAATKYVATVKEITSANKWQTFKQAEAIFQQKYLDGLWDEYKEIVEREQKEELICSDIETVINESVLGLHSWRSIVLQIPGTLTALGLIGTFIGLIIGIRGIAFSSVEAAISSITLLLAGIETAFYTSIVGVILSMVYNISYKFVWSAMLREFGVFTNEFHKCIFPDEEIQKRQMERSDVEKIMECLDRLPKGVEYFFKGAGGAGVNGDETDEKSLMTEIWNGLKNEDFIFYIQPRCDLNTKKITSGEALMRWNHSRLGIVSPTIFLPILEKNGYITKLDAVMWESVCKTIKAWIDADIRPVPISVNISKTDIHAMNVAVVVTELVQRYQVPPQYLQMEIAENAYIQSFDSAHDTEEKLRQAGFTVIINGGKGKYDTMSSLAESKADALKLEYSALAEKQKGDALAFNAVVEQGRKARVKLIVSGIENVKQLSLVKKAGFTEGQGFFLYKPVDVDEFETLLIERK